MVKFFSKLIDDLSNYFAPRKGLLPIIGIILIILNFIVGLLPLGWIASSDVLLHLGVIVAIIGIMLAWAL